jgi:hypothetical protein
MWDICLFIYFYLLIYCQFDRNLNLVNKWMNEKITKQINKEMNKLQTTYYNLELIKYQHLLIWQTLHILLKGRTRIFVLIHSALSYSYVPHTNCRFSQCSNVFAWHWGDWMYLEFACPQTRHLRSFVFKFLIGRINTTRWRTKVAMFCFRLL